MIRLVPVTQKAARAWMRQVHRHLRRYPAGDICRVGLAVDGELVAVVVAGRPARQLQDGFTVQVSRLASEAPVSVNACSRLYGAIRRAVVNLGYRRIFTYTRMDEPGTSLEASGFADCGITDGGEWGRDGRERKPAEDADKKRRWKWETAA